MNTRITAQALTAVAGLKWLVRPDWKALGLSVSRLRGLDATWVSWQEYCLMITALAGPDADHQKMMELGRVLMDHAARTPFRHLGNLAGASHHLYQATFGWMLSSNVKVLHPSVSPQADGSLRIRLDLDPGHRSCEAVFWSIAGTMQRLPIITGLPDADVDVELDAAGATYRVRLHRDRMRPDYLRHLEDGLAEPLSQLRSLPSMDLVVSDMLGDLQRANQLLIEAEARWLALAENLPGLVAVIKPDGTIETLYGSGPAQAARAEGGRIQDLVSAEQPDTVQQAIQQVLAGDGPVDLRLRSVEPDGRDAWWSARLGLLPGGEPRIIAIGIDITARHDAETALRANKERLERTQKREAISRLSGGLAHDINNILAAIQGWAELAQAGADDPVTVHQAAEGIHELVERASALTRRLLDASRGSRDSSSSRADLGEALRDFGRLLERVIGEEIQLDSEIHDAPLPVPLAADRLEQVVVNLVVNARDAMPQGGRLGLRTSLDPERRQAVLTITDTGTGMSPEVRQRAMEPFYTTKPVGLGSGLGLSTVRDIVESAGGSLHIDSVQGEGTRVEVRLPLAQGPSDGSGSRRSVDAAELQGSCRVLLVEDQAEVRDMIRALLSQRGFQVHTADSGSAGLALMERDPPPPVDILLSDVVMPGMRGPELARRLRQRRPGLPVLLMSGFMDKTLDEIEVGGGPTGFLRKPFNTDDLVARLLRLVQASSRSVDDAPSAPGRA